MVAAYLVKKPSIKQMKKHLDLAKERVSSAEILLEKGNYRDAVSRAYYGFFDAASALLLTEKLVAKTHAGLITLFGQHFVKQKKIKSKFAVLFRKAKEAREEANYELYKTFTKEQTQRIVSTAIEFIKEVQRIIEIQNK